MPTLLDRLASHRRLAVFAATAAITMLACGREPTGSTGASGGAARVSQPLSWIVQWPSGIQQFQAAGGSIADFTKVRVILNNPDGSVALDTVIAFPPGQVELQVTLSVPLPASAPASGQPLALNLDYQNAAGQTVFHGGPVTVNAVPTVPGADPPPPSPITIPIAYTGPGANATRVRITPRTLTLGAGAAFSFSAQALDAGGSVVPNAPIVFTSGDVAVATINAATGAGTAGSIRGTTSIVAQLLTGPTDEATLTVVPPPARLALESGGGQSANVNANLANPVVVRVTAADGIGAAGVPVTFAVATGGGSVGTASATTDANGNAQTSWRLGGSVGAQTITASASGLSGSPLTVTATARPLDPARVVFATQPPSTVDAGATLAPAIVVNVVDITGAVATSFTGPVTIAMGPGAPGGASIRGTTTVNAVAGVATFNTLRFPVTGTYTLVASAPNLVSATSGSFTVVPGAATRLVFLAYPVIGATAGAPFDPITVEARDSLNNVATSFRGTVSLSLGGAASLSASAQLNSQAGGAGTARAAQTIASALDGAVTAVAVGGVATFESLRLTTAGSFRLIASAAGLSPASGPTFSIAPGPAKALRWVRGGGALPAGSTTTVAVQVIDEFGNATGAGVTVDFIPAAGSGTVNPASAVANSAGVAQTAWTLSGSAGVQSLTVTSSGLASTSVSSTASAPVGGGGTAGDFIIIHDVNWADNSNGLPNPGNVQFVKNLVNFSITGTRSAANKVMLFDFGTLSFYNFSGNWSGMATLIQSQGVTPYMTTTRSDLVTVPADVKLVILHLPTGTFSASEVNGLKAFLAQGGRVLYIGENSGFQYTLTAANTLLATMGATTTATGACAVGYMSSITHQLTTNIPASGSGSVFVNCASIINPGTGDVVLMRDGSNNAIVVIANVNTTPIPIPAIVGGSAQLKAAGVQAEPLPHPTPESTMRPPPKRP